MEEKNIPSTAEEAQEKFTRLIAFLIALVTVITALIGYLQGDASARDDQANRDSKRYSLEAFGNQITGDTKVNFDYNVAYQAYYEYDLLANSAYNRDDTPAAARYETVRDGTTALSPMLQSPYFDQVSMDAPDVARYEADTYLVHITQLREEFLAASGVKDAWDNKANTYIVHITMLAVALFLLGMSLTVSSNLTRWIFAGGGLALTLVASAWAGATWAKPVFDLRSQGNAIQDYATGVGLAYQDRNEEAVASFDSAIQAYPGYTNAFIEQAGAYAAMGNKEGAIASYEMARSLGDQSANTAGQLAWLYYLEGRFDDAAGMNRAALSTSPDELWIRFDLGLSLLAGGKGDEALVEYRDGMRQAADQVAAAKSAGTEPPSYLWWSLADASDSLDSLMITLETGEGEPTPESVVDPGLVAEQGQYLLTQLKSLAVALEYTGAAPQSELTATVSSFSFTTPVYSEETGEVVEYSEPTDTFANGTQEFSIQFDYDGMQDGQEMIFKLYINGEEDPSWRIVSPWELGASGTAEIPVSYAYSDTFTFEPGEYVVELYVDHQLAQRGWFYVEEGE